METNWLNRADFLQNLLDAIPAFLFIVDPDIRVFHLNAAAEKIFGIRKKSVLLKRGGEVLHCLHAYQTAEGCGRSSYCGTCVIRKSVGNAFQGQKVFRETANMQLFDHGVIREICLMITVNTVIYEGKKLVLLVLEDVTKEKEMEEALQQRSAQLEAANRELEAFSYSVSHDLKAPLRVIDGLGRNLEEDFAEQLDPAAQEYLHRIRAAAARMSGLIDAMLSLSRTTQSIMRRETVDLSNLALGILAELQRNAPERRTELMVEPGISVNADRKLLRVMLENLLGNAWKFTGGQPLVRIELGVIPQDGDAVYFVKDNGAGFDMAYADRLFLPFSRLHTATQFPGTGIGLATVQRIVHRHGGRIWAEGAPGKGARFCFTL